MNSKLNSLATYEFNSSRPALSVQKVTFVVLCWSERAKGSSLKVQFTKKKKEQQVNGKGVKFYTAQSAFLSVVMKKHNIITYEEDFTWSGFRGAWTRL